MRGNCLAQSDWLLEIRALSAFPSTWLYRSVMPSVCGWYEVDMDSFAPMIRWTSFQNADVNLVSRSDTIFDGNPWSLKTFSTSSSATAFAPSVVRQATRWTIRVIRSMTTQTMLYVPVRFFDSGSGPTKSNAMSVQG